MDKKIEISIDTVLSWRWRCVVEQKVISGVHLLVDDSPTAAASRPRYDLVDFEKLHCTCGSAVVPHAPQARYWCALIEASARAATLARGLVERFHLRTECVRAAATASSGEGYPA